MTKLLTHGVVGAMRALTRSGHLDWERHEDPINPDGDDACRLIGVVEPPGTEIFARCEDEVVSVVGGQVVERLHLTDYSLYWTALGATARNLDNAS